MSETISLDWIGARLRAIQAEQRTLRSENELIRTSLTNTLGEVLRLLSERIGNFEALSEARVESVEARLGGIGAQLGRIEALLKPAP